MTANVTLLRDTAGNLRTETIENVVSVWMDSPLFETAIRLEVTSIKEINDDGSAEFTKHIYPMWAVHEYNVITDGVSDAFEIAEIYKNKRGIF
jgi:hypothetical protein